MFKIGKLIALCAPLLFNMMPLAASDWLWQEGVITEVSGTRASATTASLQNNNIPSDKQIEYRLWDEAQLTDNRVSARPAAKIRGSESDNYSSTNRKVPLMKARLSDNIVIPSPGFTAFTSDELNSFPPNAAIGVGPTQILVCASGGIRTFDKSTGLADGAIDMNSDAFFALVSEGARTDNARLRYDRSSGRWFIVMSAGTPLRILLAISDATGIISQNTNWNFFSFTPSTLTPSRDVSQLIEDFPTLGLDDNALYIGLNIFRQDNGALENSDAFVVRKSSLYDSGPLVATAFRNLVDENGEGPISPQGVNNFDENPVYGYFAGADKSYFGKLDFRAIKDAATTPSISTNITLTVFATGYPLLVNHLGNKMGLRGYLDPVDDRLRDSHIRDGKLYTVHNIGVNYRGISSYDKFPTRTGCRWYEIDVGQWNSPVLTQAGTVFASSKLNNPSHKGFLTPSVMSNGLHSLALGATSAGTNYHINATFAVRHNDDVAGMMNGPYFFTDTPYAYNPTQDPCSLRGRRWGDYSGTVIDPADNMTIWTLQQFCNDEDSYGLGVARIPAAPPADLTHCDPASLPAGQTGMTLHVTGTRVEGSAFYDPGAGFAGRLSVSVDDVSVTAVNWIDETHVDIVVSTIGSTSGAKRITLANPDGQQLHADNLFSIE